MKSAEKIRFGLLGCGRWGRLLIRGVQECGGSVTAVYNRTTDTAHKVAGGIGASVYERWEDLIEADEIDAVLIVTPHSDHEAQALAATEAGKHIFCEKPLAMNAQQGTRMVDAAHRNGVKLMCGQITRLYPVYAKVGQLVRDGRIGEISSINVPNLVHIDRVNWWADQNTMGALLHSPGIHFIDFLLSVGGAASMVTAFESKIRVQKTVDYADNLYLLIQFSSGAIGGLECTVSSLTSARTGCIVGTEGSLTFDPGEGLIEVARWDGSNETFTDISPRSGEEMEMYGIRKEIRSFIRWVADDNPPILTGEDGLRALEVLDAAYASIQSAKAVAIGSRGA